MPLPAGLGAGMMPAGLGPFGLGTPSPLVEQTTIAVNCRLIDTQVRAYVSDADGNPPPMDGTANRVFLLCCYNDRSDPVITPANLAAREARLVKALLPLTQGLNPAISNLAVAATPKADGNGVSVVCTYMNLLTSKPESVVVR